MIPQSHFLIVSAILFALGIFGALSRRNSIRILMCVELILNAANINLLAFSKFSRDPQGLGEVFVVFVIAITASSAVVGLALVIKIYRNARTVFIDKINLMKW